MLTIQATDFTKFLGKVMMTDTQALNECVMKFNNDGLHIDATNATKMCRVESWLKTNAFENYEAIGSVGINEMEKLIVVLNRFNGKVTLKKEGNLLTVTGDKKNVDIELISEAFITGDTSTPNLEFSDVFTLNSSKLSEISKDAKVNKDATIQIETVAKGVIFKNTGKYKFQNLVQCDTCKGGVKVNFGQPFLDCTSKLEGDLEVSVANDYPARIQEKNEKEIITIIVAPSVEEQ